MPISERGKRVDPQQTPPHTEHPNSVCASLRISLQLILQTVATVVELFQLLAHPTRLWAKGEHRLFVGVALAIDRPIGTTGVLVLAHLGANAASHGALGQHHRGILQALIVQTPDGARSGVLVGAHGVLADLQVARRGASLHRVARVGSALALLRPSGTIVVRVFARWLAHTARHGAIHIHETRIFFALPLLGPVVAIRVNIGTLGGAKAA